MSTKTVLGCGAFIIAYALIVAPIAISQDALAGGGNKASQKIEQNQKSSQKSQSISGGGNFLSGNNINFQNQQNFGHNVLGQSSSD